MAGLDEGGFVTVVGGFEFGGWNAPAGLIDPAVVEPVHVFEGGATRSATCSRAAGMHGVGVNTAAKILGKVRDVTRFPSSGHFASYTGTAPVEASSGDVRRHRLNRGGNRQLNTALHLIAVCQIRDPSPGQVYYQRKLAQAKTPEEARRSLKRHLSNVVHAHLIADHRRRTPTS